MKKLILLCAMGLCTISFNSLAGDDDANFKKGIRAGWQLSNFYGDNYSSSLTEPFHSFYVGIYGEKKLVPLLRFGAGIEFSQTGTRVKDFDDTKFVRSNLYIPLYLKLKLGPLFALGGIAPNFGVGNKQTLLGEDIPLDDKDKTNTLDSPVFLGLGVNIMMISIEARYHWGLMDLNKDSNYSEFKQQYFQLGAALHF